MKLKYRMYNLTLYSLSGIQKGIQSYHAGMEYARLYWNDEDFQSWLENDKTVIILNGGTACQYEPYGSMEQNRDIIIHDLNIKFAYFLEPDLNQSLSGIAFLVPSEVYDKETYPVFDINIPEIRYKGDDFIEFTKTYNKSIPDWVLRKYELWLEGIGGETNRKLRVFLQKFRLA